MIEGDRPFFPERPLALELSRRIWNLRAAADRGEDVERDLKAALAERAAYRCREI
jgi:hypothetical protein